MEFEGKVALVTGGSRGIGRAYVNELLKLGMKVCICDVREETAKEYIDSLPEKLRLNIIFQKCDVSSFDNLKEAFEKVISVFKRLDLVINNAAVVNERKWMDMIKVNLIGVIHGVKLAFEYMGKDKGHTGGLIINTASEAGLDPQILLPVYGATKHGVVGLTKCYGNEYHYEKTGVTVNAICPGPVQTEFYEGHPAVSINEEDARRFKAFMQPIQPEDVAKALLRLLEDGKNGAFLRVDKDGLRYV